MADKGVASLCSLLQKPYPNHVEELRLHNVKGLGDLQSAKPEEGERVPGRPRQAHTRERLLASVLEEVSGQNLLKALQLSEMSLEDDGIIGFIEDMISAVDLNELDLSFARISQRGLGRITGALVGEGADDIGEHQNIQTLSLKGVSQLNLSPLDLVQKELPAAARHLARLEKSAGFAAKEAYIEGIEGKEEGWDRGAAMRQYCRKWLIMANLKEYLKNSTSLQHVDLSLLELGEELVELVAAARGNAGLIAMHLSGNHLSYDILERICALVSVNVNTVGAPAQAQRYMGELGEGDQIQGIVQADAEGLAANRRPFDKRKASESVAQRDNYTELNNLLQKEVRKGIHDQIQDLLHAKNAGPKARGSSQAPSQLVLFRKLLQPG